MRIRNFASFVCGTFAVAALLGLPGVNAFADTSTQVTCKDGSTSPHGGRGSCSGHGGIDKAATAAAAGGTAGGGRCGDELFEQGSDRLREPRRGTGASQRLPATHAPATPDDDPQGTTCQPGGSARRRTGDGVGQQLLEGLPLSE